MYGGLKIGRSLPSLPLRLEVESIPMSSSLINAFNDRVYLVYTGTQVKIKDLRRVLSFHWSLYDSTTKQFFSAGLRWFFISHSIHSFYEAYVLLCLYTEQRLAKNTLLNALRGYSLAPLRGSVAVTLREETNRRTSLHIHPNVDAENNDHGNLLQFIWSTSVYS